MPASSDTFIRPQADYSALEVRFALQDGNEWIGNKLSDLIELLDVYPQHRDSLPCALAAISFSGMEDGFLTYQSQWPDAAPWETIPELFPRLNVLRWLPDVLEDVADAHADLLDAEALQARIYLEIRRLCKESERAHQRIANWSKESNGVLTHERSRTWLSALGYEFITEDFSGKKDRVEYFPFVACSGRRVLLESRIHEERWLQLLPENRGLYGWSAEFFTVDDSILDIPRINDPQAPTQCLPLTGIAGYSSEYGCVDDRTFIEERRRRSPPAF